MAKRRTISSEILHDEHLNNISIESQYLFTRLLVISDDCGVVPGNEYVLKSMLNLQNGISKNLNKLLEILVNSKLLIKFEFNNKIFYCFKKSSFDLQQSFLIKNRTRSEYLKMKIDDFEEFYRKLQEITGNYIETEVINIKDKEKGIKDKEKGIKDKEKEQLFINTDYYNNKKLFIDEFYKNDNYKKYDANYYYEAVKNWSESKNKKMKCWIATARTWALKDDKENKPKLTEFKTIKQDPRC